MRSSVCPILSSSGHVVADLSTDLGTYSKVVFGTRNAESRRCRNLVGTVPRSWQQLSEQLSKVSTPTLWSFNKRKALRTSPHVLRIDRSLVEDLNAVAGHLPVLFPNTDRRARHLTALARSSTAEQTLHVNNLGTFEE